MRPRFLLRAACVAAVAAAGACAVPAGEEPGDDRVRGGSLTVTRARVAGFEPQEALSGIASFFLPPGPALPAPLVEEGECDYSTPEVGPTPEPTAPPVIEFRDAGETLTLRSNETVLELGRVAGTEGQIHYAMRSDVPPESLQLGVAYALQIEGGNAGGDVPATEIASALAVPGSVSLYAPDFSLPPAALVRSDLQLGWSPQGTDEPVLVRLVITGSAGTATLVCATRDDGFHEIDAAWMRQFPAGGGILTVSRSAVTWSELSADVWFHAAATVTEGGAVTLP